MMGITVYEIMYVVSFCSHYPNPEGPSDQFYVSQLCKHTAIK
jgi:hypothetical protein